MIYISDFVRRREEWYTLKFIAASISMESPGKIADADCMISDNRMEIVSLQAHMPRSGYGSTLLTYIERYCVANEIAEIFGRVYENSPIGLDHLIRFYQKNGYTVCETKNGYRFTKRPSA